MKDASKKQLKDLLEKIPEKSIEARKDQYAMSLMKDIRTVCMRGCDKNSDIKLLYNLEDAGKRLNYMRIEFSKDDCDEIIKAAINFIMSEYGNDKDFRISARNNIEWVFAYFDDPCRIKLVRKPQTEENNEDKK